MINFKLNLAMEKEFEVKRLKNGIGDSHLLVITEPSIEDVNIGSVVILIINLK